MPVTGGNGVRTKCGRFIYMRDLMSIFSSFFFSFSLSAAIVVAGAKILSGSDDGGGGNVRFSTNRRIVN